MGTMSNLAQGAYIAHSNNYQKGRQGYKVYKFTPHIMAGILTGKQCAVNIFQKANRYASANYCIGNDGDIVCNVYEEDRAYTSSSRVNDNQAITVEVSNCEIGGQWKISDAAWNSLVKLAVDVCTRYNFRLVYDGTPNGSLTRHNMFANTTCPGAYLQSKFQELANTVNAILDGNSTQPSTPVSNTNSYLIKVTTDALNIRSGAGTNNPIVGCIRDKGTYTIIETQGNWGKLKSGAGWICLDYTNKINNVSTSTAETKTNGHYVGETVTINGVYTSSTSTNKLTPAVKTGVITKIVAGAANPYLLNNGNIGWVNDSCIVAENSTQVQTPSANFSKGQKVTLKTSASKYCTGQTIPSSIKGKSYTIMQVGSGNTHPDGVLLQEIMSWVYKKDVQ